VRAKWAGIAGLIAVIAWLLTACGQAGSSVKEAVSSVAASRSAAATQSAPTVPPTQGPTAQVAPTQTAQPALSSGGGAAAAPTLTPGAPAEASGTPAAGTGHGFPWGWFWLAVGVALAAGIALAAWRRARRRRSSAAAGWQTRVIDAYAKGAALHDAMAAAETPGALAAPDAALRWSDIQRRADDYGELLYGMEQAAPGDQERIVVAGVLASLQAARSAMDAERSAWRADGSLSGTVRDRLAQFASALSLLRQPNVAPA
jgi:hypothetical protein